MLTSGIILMGVRQFWDGVAAGAVILVAAGLDLLVRQGAGTPAEPGRSVTWGRRSTKKGATGMLRNYTSDRRGAHGRQRARGRRSTAAAGAMGLPAAALAQGGAFGPPRKFIWVPQALGDWDMAFQVGARDFCEMVGWEYQRIGNPVYSVAEPRRAGQQRDRRPGGRDRDLARERRAWCSRSSAASTRASR